MTAQHNTTQHKALTVRRLRYLVDHAPSNVTAQSVAMLVARFGLAVSFLSAVADRMGLWGPAGTGAVSWGNFNNFVGQTQALAPYLPDSPAHSAAVAATVLELILGLALLLGVALRWAAWGSAALLSIFGLSMAIYVDLEAPLGYSVFTAAGAAVVLALAPSNTLVWRLGSGDGR
ncbi:MauE/DoxX family redox-associated membrane protein [Streptomyces zhihengii]|uniref:MauE/DoxX family redox-associated membrane protein n=1 Tax=Streptomyces zhihengii TaxID=1818004 RepID=UPI0033BD8174